MAEGRQVAIPEPDTRERIGGQTDYEHDESGASDGIAGVRPPQTKPPKFIRRDITDNLFIVPIAAQEDRALIVYDYAQLQFSVPTTGGSVVAGRSELVVVDANWFWLIDKVAIFGTAAGGVKLYDGAAGDDSACFAFQPGVAAPALGGIQNPNIVASPRTPITVAASGVDANAQLAIGLWIRRCKWVWNEPDYIQEDRLLSDG